MRAEDQNTCIALKNASYPSIVGYKLIVYREAIIKQNNLHLS